MLSTHCNVRWTPEPWLRGLRGLIASLAVVCCGCSPAAVRSAVEPERIVEPAAQAETAASAPPRPLRILIAFWNAPRRRALTGAMQRGIAVMRYADGRARLLEGCSVVGRYTRADVEPKRDVVAVRPVPWIGAPLSLEPWPMALLEIRTTGALRTVVPMASRRYLEGACSGATHLVSGQALGWARPFDPNAPAEPRARWPDTAQLPPDPPEAPVAITLLPLSDRLEKLRGRPEPLWPMQLERVTGLWLDDGVCDPEDRAACIAYCAAGNPASCHNLALLIGVRTPRAVVLLRAACDRDLGEACHALGYAYRAYGHEVYQASPSLFERACHAGVGIACDRRSSRERSHRSNWKLREYWWLEKGCRAGYPSSCGTAYHLLSDTGQYELALDVLQRACRGGHLVACMNWATLLEEGKGARADPERAVRIRRFACGEGELAACVALLERGVMDTGDPLRSRLPLDELTPPPPTP